MKLPIHAITTSVLYHDFLDRTLPRTLEVVERVTVVTAPDDFQTRSVCEKHGVDPVVTDLFTANNSCFDRGAAIGAALSTVDPGWVLLLDADILLPAPLEIPLSVLDRDAIHGCERRLVVGSGQLSELEGGRRDFPLMRPHIEEGKPMPIGFFQLFHSSGGGSHPSYPTAAESDAAFTRSFASRSMLPLTVWHLDSVESNLGDNWWGRTTPLFS